MMADRNPLYNKMSETIVIIFLIKELLIGMACQIPASVKVREDFVKVSVKVKSTCKCMCIREGP